jgi:hypothetical protein
MSELAWHLPISDPRSALAVVQNVSSGAWESNPLVTPNPVARFWLVEPCGVGPVVSFCSGILFDRALASVLAMEVGLEVLTILSMLERPNAQEVFQNYQLIRPVRGISIKALSRTSESRPSIAYVLERPGSIVVNTVLRSRLEAGGVPGLSFADPIFAA